MYYYPGIFWIFIYCILLVNGHRELFEKKCKRECNSQQGSLDCWKTTTNGFAYGLSTAMVDYCQVVLKLRQTIDDKFYWYNISHNILIKQMNDYNLKKKARQLTKENVEKVATSLLDKCFYSSSSISTYEPSCPSCSVKQIQSTKQWRLISIIILSICLFFVFLILLMYKVYTNHIRRSYESIR